MAGTTWNADYAEGTGVYADGDAAESGYMNPHTVSATGGDYMDVGADDDLDGFDSDNDSNHGEL